MKKKKLVLGSIILLAVVIVVFLSQEKKTVSEPEQVYVSEFGEPKSSEFIPPYGWTNEEYENVQKSQPALVTSVVQNSDGWVFSLDYLSINPNFKPGISGPYWINENSEIRTFLLSFNSLPIKNGVLLCGDHKKVEDWKELIGEVPYGFTIDGTIITQIHLICVP